MGKTIKPTSYALKQTVFVRDRMRKLLSARYITVHEGLSWADAKAKRRANRTLSIVPQYNAVGDAG